ncbi:hypothetical protein [Jannaschia faecimaris]|nr:hypothetical protein [Jannaschia faecimaris]
MSQTVEVDEVTEEVVEAAAEEGFEQVSIRDRWNETEYEMKKGTESLIVVYDKLAGRMETEEGEEIEEGARHPGLKGIETALEAHLRNAERAATRDEARAERRAERDDRQASRSQGRGNGNGGNGGGNNGNGGGNGGGNGNGRK